MKESIGDDFFEMKEGEQMRNLKVVKLAGIVLVVAVAVLMGISSQATAQSTLFGVAHMGPDGPSTLYTIDPGTGAVTPVGPIGFERCSGMDFDTSGTLFATCERADKSDTHVLITIDPVTGAGTEVGPTGLESFKDSNTFGDGFDTASDISFRNSDNKLFAFTYDNFGLATVDNLAVGAMTEVGFDLGAFDLKVEGFGSAIAFSSGDVLFYADSGGLFTLDQAGSGTTSFTALSYPFASPVSPRPNAMDFQPETGVLYASVVNGFGDSRQNFLGVIDTGTGEVTIIGQTVAGLDALAWSSSLAEIPFSDFSIRKAEIKFTMTSTINDRFKFRGELTLDALSNGIDPLNEKVMVTVGTSAITIPAGSFTEEGYEKFRFKGIINDAVVKMEIKQKAGDTFKFKVEAKWVDLTGTANPVDIGVAIGDDVGTATIDMEGELEFEAQREDEHKHNKHHNHNKHHKHKEKDRDKDDDDDDEKDD